MLRAFTSYQQNDWDSQLTAAEFACNNAPNQSTGMTPFQLNHGQDPWNPYTSLTHIPDQVPAEVAVGDIVECIVDTSDIGREFA